MMVVRQLFAGLVLLCLTGAANAGDRAKSTLGDVRISLVASIPTKEVPRAISLGARGEHVAAVVGLTVQIWSLPDGSLIKQIDGHGGSVFVSDNPCYVVTAAEKAGWSLALHDCKGGDAATAEIPTRSFERIGVSPACRAVAVLSDGVSTYDFSLRPVKLVAAKTGSRFPKRVDALTISGVANRCVAYAAVSSPDGKAAPAALFAVDLKSSAPAKNLVALGPTDGMQAPWFSSHGSIAVSPSGNLMALRGTRRAQPDHPAPLPDAPWETVEIVDASARAAVRTVRLENQSASVRFLAFLDDDHLLFDTGQETLLLEPISGQPQKVSFEKSDAFQSPILIDSAPSAHRFAVAGLGEIRVYDYEVTR